MMVYRLACLFLLGLSACAPLPPPSLVQTSQAVAAPSEQRQTVTILVSIDGFRPDYLARGITPNLSALAKTGVSAPMRPSFPTKTFPNHWAIVTGARPDRSGIVANRMEDAARPGESFTMASDDPFWWNGAEPIWVTAEKAGVRTAPLLWPGSNVDWGARKDPSSPHVMTAGTRSSDWAQFNTHISGEQRVNGLLDLLRRPASIRPAFLTLYFDGVDRAGHDRGPFADATISAVAQVDREIGMLIAGLAELGQPANLIILSDHGMGEKSSERVVPLDRVADPAHYRIIESGPFATIVPQPGREAALEAALLKPHANMQCWRKGDIPARFHYGRNSRVAPYFCLARDGWVIQPSAPARPFVGGDHGWDDRMADMQALFIANGPGFDTAFTPPAGFANVDVYPLLARLLGIAPLAGDGDPNVLAGLVKH